MRLNKIKRITIYIFLLNKYHILNYSSVLAKVYLKFIWLRNLGIKFYILIVFSFKQVK